MPLNPALRQIYAEPIYSIFGAYLVERSKLLDSGVSRVVDGYVERQYPPGLRRPEVYDHLLVISLALTLGN